MSSPSFRYDPFGTKKGRGPDRIRHATQSTLDLVDDTKWTALGPLRWDHHVVTSVILGSHDAYILEGRIYTVSTWIALLWGRLLGRPIVLWTHGWKRPEHGIRRHTRVAFYRLSRGLMVYGEFAKRLATEYGIDASAVAVVGNSIYSRNTIREYISRPVQGPAPETFTIIVACRLTTRHNIDLLFRALDRVTNLSNVQVLVVGHGTEFEHLRARSAHCRAETRFLGALYGAFELSALYAFSDLAVSPAASGLNVVQSLGFAVPVIVPNEDPSAGPEHELVRHGETGYRFKHADVDALADALTEAIANRGTLAAMGKRGQERVLRTHVAEAQAQAFDRALAEWGVGRESRS